MELTILMPCLNESETLAICIKKAKCFLTDNNVDGEILIADNGSTDGSREIARGLGARVILVEKKGYGNALIAGSEAAYGKYVIMGDADDSYDFINLMPFLEKLRDGYDLVMGNRFKGGIEKGAMPFSHRYIGNPILSFLGRLFFKSKIGDFHCGLRGYNREKIVSLGLNTVGMEYASEMVVMSELEGLRIAEVPTTLKKDGRSVPPHLRSFSDGWRHLKFLLMYAPKWLFLIPGLVLVLLGTILGIYIEINGMVGTIQFGVNTLLYCMMFILSGVDMIYFYIFTKLYALKSNFIPETKLSKKIKNINVNKGIFGGGVLFIIGLVMSLYSLRRWSNVQFGELNAEYMMKIVIPAVTTLKLGFQLIFLSFMVGILQIDRRE